MEGTQVTFYWQGDRAVCLVDDLHGWGDCSRRLKRIPTRLAPDSETPIWSTTFSLPRDAYLEYYFHDPRTGERLLDPLNPRTANNGFGNRNNFFYMPEAASTPLVQRRPGIPHGTVTRHMAPAGLVVEDGLREVHLYAPPAKEKVPLLVVYDGTDYLQRARLANIVDNLIAEKRMRPLALAMLQNGGRHRSAEYAGSDAVINWLDQEILPLASENLNLLNIRRNPGAYGVLGASMGGVMAVFTGLRMPEIFGKVICQAGAFELDGRDLAAADLIRHGHAHERLKFWMDCGRHDSLLGDNRRMRPILKQNGYDVTYREFNASHCYTAWRDDVWCALEALFPA
jgi:enterochelin esterase family protein